MAWAVVLAAGVFAGPVGVAVVLGAASAVAALDFCRAGGARPPYPAVSAGAACGVVVVALLGGAVVIGVAALAAVVLAVTAWRARGVSAPEPTEDQRPIAVQQRAAALAPVFAVAPACVVVLAQRSLVAAGVLLVAACLYDAGAYVVGTGSASRWEGPAAGVMALLPFVVIVGSAFDPPFHHGRGWILGAALVVMPFGPVLARRLVGDQRAPGVHRLDVLLLAAPVWAILGAALGVG